MLFDLENEAATLTSFQGDNVSLLNGLLHKLLVNFHLISFKNEYLFKIQNLYYLVVTS